MTALASMILAGCMTTREAAEKQFAADHPGCPATVRERRDLPAGESQAYEVTGCNSDVIYLCVPYRSYGDGDVSANCVPSGWCTQDGCDSFELSARNTFVKDKACPLDRVTATTLAPRSLVAPPDVAADPERMRIWAENHKPVVNQTRMTVTGCGAEAVYECSKPPGTRTIPVCLPDTTR